MARKANGRLVLGWQVDDDWHPRYWTSAGACAGGQAVGDLVAVPPASLKTHTAVVAQSGSGKSFFLGRLIEELLVRTRARCVVLDPNGDYRSMKDVVRTGWRNAGYDQSTRSGWLPHEAQRRHFARRWLKPDDMVIRTAEGGIAPDAKFSVTWQLVSHEVIAQGADPMMRAQVLLCHEFVKSYSFLRYLRDGGGIPFDDVIKAADDWLSDPKGQQTKRALERLTSRSVVERFVQEITGDGDQVVKDAAQKYFDDRAAFDAQRLKRALRWVEPPTLQLYLSAAWRLRHLMGSYKPDFVPFLPSLPIKRLEVYDLLSIPDRDSMFLAVDAIMESEWRLARRSWERARQNRSLKRRGVKKGTDDQRVPTFLVVDEAHNLMPGSQNALSPSAATVREKFRRVAAEGRKFGMFLILVSQRPDKIDDFVVSECGNRAVMRLDSPAVIETAAMKLGLSAQELADCPQLNRGHVILFGEWARNLENPRLYGAARRTVEGGLDIGSHWLKSRIP